MGRTLFFYISLRFALIFGQMLAVTAALVFMIDFIETARRFGNNANYSVVDATIMTALRTPTTLQAVIPFIILFAVMVFLLLMNRRREFVIVRAAGVSTGWILLPLCAFSFLVGVLSTAVLNPIAVTSIALSRDIETAFGGSPRRSGESDAPPWFTQRATVGYYVVGARRQSDGGLLLEDAIFIHLGADRTVVERIDAKTARLAGGAWQLTGAVQLGADNKPIRHDTFSIPSDLTSAFVEAQAIAVDEWSVFDLPRAIKMAKEAGRSPNALETRYQSMLGLPLLLVAMTLIAAPLTMRFRRTGAGPVVILFGIAAGFSIYVFTVVVQALGSSGVVAPTVAAWVPVWFSLFAGGGWILYQDDA